MSKRNELVELYRFIIAVSIVVHHIIYHAGAGDINNLRFGVEFFFILSGFLLISHCEKKPDESISHLMLGKIRHFYPYVVILYLVAAVMTSLWSNEHFVVNFYNHLHQLLFLSDAFKGKVSYLEGTGHLWFITEMLCATIILSALIKHAHKLYESFLCALLTGGGILQFFVVAET